MQMTQTPCRSGLCTDTRPPPTEEQQESPATPAFEGNVENVVFREPRYQEYDEVVTSARACRGCNEARKKGSESDMDLKFSKASTECKLGLTISE